MKEVKNMFNEGIKKYDVWDIILIVLSSIAFAFFIIRIPDPASNVIMQWIHSVHWGWFLAAAIIFIIRPKMKMWKK